MATSGEYTWNPSTYGPGVGYPNRAKITWTASWNQATLQWTVAWNATAQGASTAGRWTTVYGSNNGCNSYVTITDENGNVLQTKSIVAKMETVKNNTVLLEGSFTVGVTTTGTRSLIFSGQIYFETTGSAGISTASPQTFALDTVPLASYFTTAPSGVTVGSSGGVSTVNITRYNSSYTHDVTWTFGSHSQTLTGQGTSASFTIPASWLDAIPNSLTGTCYVTLVTKSGSTQVGQATTAQFTITANVVPSYTSIVYSYQGPAYSAGITNALIAGYSNMRIAVSGAAGANGSSVARIEFIKGTSTMATVNTSAASYTYDTPLLTAAETTTFTVRITDTRGKYVQQTSQSFTIKAYAVPAFTAASVYRSNSSGSPADDGTYIKITATAAATPAENSITSLQYATKETTAGYWSADANIPSGAISGYSNTTSYDVRLTATDKLGNKSYKYYTVPTQAFTMDFKVGGKGVAFGKVAETDNLVDSAWDIQAPWFIGSLGFIRQLTAADDLNNIITFGKYFQPSNGSANTPANCPTTNAFALYVVSANGTTNMNGAWRYGNQYIKDLHGNIWFRTIYTDASGTLYYTEWKVVITTSTLNNLYTGTNAVTGTWALNRCTGSFIEYPQVMTNSTKSMLQITGRLRVGSFVRTGGNPEIYVSTSLRPTTGFSATCGIRFSGSTAMPEGMVLTLATDGTLSIMTNETLTNIDNGVWYALFFGTTFFLP